MSDRASRGTASATAHGAADPHAAQLYSRTTSVPRLRCRVQTIEQLPEPPGFDDQLTIGWSAQSSETGWPWRSMNQAERHRQRLTKIHKVASYVCHALSLP